MEPSPTGLTAFNPDPNPFFVWMKDNGIQCSKCGIHNFKETGRGVIALDEIQEGEVVVEVPDDMVLMPDNCSISEQLIDYGLWNGEGDRMLEFLGLVLAVMAEKHSGKESRWGPYLDFLPPDFDGLPMFWDKEELAALKGTSVMSKMCPDINTDAGNECFIEPPTKVKYWFHEVVKSFCKEHKGLGLPQGSSCYAMYKWATALVSSYSFTLGEDNFQGMVPMWDILNHITGNANVRLNHCEDREVLQMIATKSIKRGSEVVNSFGDLSNSELLRRYGFVETCPNPHNNVEISLESLTNAISVLSQDALPADRKRMKFLVKENLVPSGGFFRIGLDGSIPPEMSEVVRLLSMDNVEFDDFKQRVLNWRCPLLRPMADSADCSFVASVVKVIGHVIDNKRKEYATSDDVNGWSSRFVVAELVRLDELGILGKVKEWLVANWEFVKQHPMIVWQHVR